LKLALKPVAELLFELIVVITSLNYLFSNNTIRPGSSHPINQQLNEPVAIAFTSTKTARSRLQTLRVRTSIDSSFFFFFLVLLLFRLKKEEMKVK